MSNSWLARTAAGAALGLAATAAGAQVTPGSTLHFTGTVDVIHADDHTLTLDFKPDVIFSRAPNTGSFAVLDLAPPPGVAGRIRNFAVDNGVQHVPGFVTIGGYTFDLLYMPAGTSGPDDCLVDPAPDQRCTPPHHGDAAGLSTPFTLANMASGDPGAPINSVAWFDLQGTVRGPGSSVASSFVGTFEAIFLGLSYQEVLFAAETGALTGVEFSARFTALAAVPEPSTYGLVATGLLGVLGAARRRAREGRAVRRPRGGAGA
jgi:hypothetical protein